MSGGLVLTLFAVAGQINVVDGGHLIKCLILLFQCSFKYDEILLRCFSSCGNHLCVCMFFFLCVCGLGLTGFVQFIDIMLSNYLIASAYLTCKQYYNAAEKRKSNNSGYNA